MASKFEIDPYAVNDINEKITNLLANAHLVTSEDIHMRCECLTEVLSTSAEIAGSFKAPKRNKAKKEHPWFDNECRSTRNCYYKAKNIFRKTKDMNDRPDMIR